MSDTTIPMTSTRVGDGVYEVLGTSRNVRIQRAYHESYTERGVMVADGWHLIVDEEWWQTFATKRAALQACQRSVEL